MKAYSRSCGML